MKMSTSTSVLASFATLKSLSDEKKYQNPYQILREFIQYIITADSLYSFTAIEMKNSLSRHFGFSIPEAVIRTSLKKMPGMSLDHGVYNVSLNKSENNEVFEAKKKEAEDSESYIIQLLTEYISSKNGEEIVDKEVLERDLILFLTEDQLLYSNGYTELISEFVLMNEHDADIQRRLNAIREGSVLYIGLSHNINEIGSIKKQLTLYLGTEILFSLIGYNGEIYRQFTQDFFEQVRVANSGNTKKILLRYFSEPKKEIDEFFDIAYDIVEGKRQSLFDKPAMQAIINGCNTGADVDVQRSDFYHKIEFGFGVKVDTNENYYDEEYFSTNLESFEYTDENEKNRKKELALKFISHINKLRKGNRYYNDIDSECIVVTNSKTTLIISKEQVDRIKEEEQRENLCAFAVSLDRITSLLWYKLGNGFSQKVFPSSVSAVLKARTVLSSSIAKKAEREFEKVRQQYKEGQLTEDQVAARIITLRAKPVLPENLEGEDIEEIMDFSPEYLSRFEEQVKENQNLLKEKEEVIKSIQADTEARILKKDEQIASQEEIIKDKSDENAQLRRELEKYQNKEAIANEKKQKRINILKFVGCIIWKPIIIVFITAMVLFCQKKFKFSIPPLLYAVVDIVALVIFVCGDVRKAKGKFFPKPSKNDTH